MTRHCRHPLLAIAAFVGFTAYLAAAVAAQAASCETRDNIISKLHDIYGESRLGLGLAGEASIFEVWTSDATGSWTILETTLDGLTCVMAVGEGWIDEEPMLAGEAL